MGKKKQKSQRQVVVERIQNFPEDDLKDAKFANQIFGNFVKTNRILSETIGKEDVTLERLHNLTFFDGENKKRPFPEYQVNPFNKRNHQFVTGKPWVEGPKEDPNPRFLESVDRCLKNPVDRNMEKFGSTLPETSNQEFGWFTKFTTVPSRDLRIDRPKRLTDVSKYMDIFWSYYPPPEPKFHPRNK